MKIQKYCNRNLKQSQKYTNFGEKYKNIAIEI